VIIGELFDNCEEKTEIANRKGFDLSVIGKDIGALRRKGN
jgi:hypothetical protein